MTEKELKKLSRAELLELLLIQTRETERLQAQLEQVQQKIRDRYLRIRETGDLAQAVLAVNGVMEAAQAAAAQYLENIARMEADTKKQCEKMLEEAKIEARRIRNGVGSPEKKKPSKPTEVPPKPQKPEPVVPTDKPLTPQEEADQLLAELHQLLGDE